MTTQIITLFLQLLTKELNLAIDYRNTWKDIKGGESEIDKANKYICKLEKAIKELNNELKTNE